jgi:hypothetical protein
VAFKWEVRWPAVAVRPDLTDRGAEEGSAGHVPFSAPRLKSDCAFGRPAA